MNALATMLNASLVADSLALPAHWIYDQAQLAARFGPVTELLAPPSDANYHQGQPAGGQTHYGTQTLVLMRAIQANPPFDAATFAAHWQAFWAADTATYRDGATRKTLERLAEGVPAAEAGSTSTDLGGASRIAPLVAATVDLPEDEAVSAAWVQTGMTHKDLAVCEAAAFLTRAARAGLAGAALPEALAKAATAEYLALPVKRHLATAHEAAKACTPEAIAAIGLACPVDQSFPAVLALALAHPTDLEAALILNVACGGDQAARGLALGLLLGSVPGATVPERWLAAWQARDEATTFMARLAPVS